MPRIDDMPQESWDDYIKKEYDIILKFGVAKLNEIKKNRPTPLSAQDVDDLFKRPDSDLNRRIDALYKKLDQLIQEANKPRIPNVEPTLTAGMSADSRKKTADWEKKRDEGISSPNLNRKENVATNKQAAENKDRLELHPSLKMALKNAPKLQPKPEFTKELKNELKARIKPSPF